MTSAVGALRIFGMCFSAGLGIIGLGFSLCVVYFLRFVNILHANTTPLVKNLFILLGIHSILAALAPFSAWYMDHVKKSGNIEVGAKTCAAAKLAPLMAVGPMSLQLLFILGERIYAINKRSHYDSSWNLGFCLLGIAVPHLMLAVNLGGFGAMAFSSSNASIGPACSFRALIAEGVLLPLATKFFLWGHVVVIVVVLLLGSLLKYKSQSLLTVQDHLPSFCRERHFEISGILNASRSFDRLAFAFFFFSFASFVNEIVSEWILLPTAVNDTITLAFQLISHVLPGIIFSHLREHIRWNRTVFRIFKKEETAIEMIATQPQPRTQNRPVMRDLKPELSVAPVRADDIYFEEMCREHQSTSQGSRHVSLMPPPLPRPNVQWKNRPSKINVARLSKI